MPKPYRKQLKNSSEYVKQWHKENPFQKWHIKHYEKNTPTDQETFDNTVFEFFEEGHTAECAHGMANNRVCSCGKYEDEELFFN